MARLKQKQRQLAVPHVAHPLTMNAESEKKTNPVMTKFFSPVPNPNQKAKSKTRTVQISISDVDDDEDEHDKEKLSDDEGDGKCSSKRNTFGLRLCPRSAFLHDFEWFVNEYGEILGKQLWFEADETDGYDNGDGAADISPKSGQTVTSAEESTTIKSVPLDVSTCSDEDTAAEQVPLHFEDRIDSMMKDINVIRKMVPPLTSRVKSDIVTAYASLMRKPGWTGKTVKSHFPLQRFSRYLDTDFPETKSMIVSEDRHEWHCRFCPGAGQNLKEVNIIFHPQNAMKHFRSKVHCARVTSDCGTSDAVDAVVDHARAGQIFKDDLTRAIMDDAIISCSRQSLPLSAVPVVMQVAARALIACRGRKPIPEAEIMQARKVSPLVASAVQRLNIVTKSETVRGGRTRPACVRGRCWVADRMLALTKISLTKKAEFLLSCPFLSCTCDESETYSSSAPLSAALQGCSWDFKWANLFMGQSDVSADKSGEGCFESLRSLIRSVHSDLWSLIVFTCFDGASAMRSTPMYAGLDSHPGGKSLHSFLKKDLNSKLPNLHCLCHQGDLALKHALKICSRWTDLWMDHVKGVFRWFSKSPSRKSALKKLHKDMMLLEDVVTWRMVYPRYYCPTRWLGIEKALTSLLAVADLLDLYADDLVDKGFRPYRGEDEDVPPAEAKDTRIDEEDDEADRRVHRECFHQWGNSAWDLKVVEPQGDNDIVDEEERLAMETGRASRWKDLATGSKKTRCKLVSETIGLTAFMYGIDSIMADALAPYKLFIKRLQTQVVPIGYRIRSWTSMLFRELHQMFLSDSPRYGYHLKKWLLRDDVNDSMADQVRAMGRSFTYHFLTNLRLRYQPYWKLILAMEMINPNAPGRIIECPSAWEGVKDLVNRCMINVDPDDVVANLRKQLDEAAEWSVPVSRAVEANLLKFYHERHQAIVDNQTKNEFVLAERFARLVFSIHVTSSIVETYFSKTRYIKNLHRSSLRDALASATIHLQQLRRYTDENMIELIEELGIDLQSAFESIENDITDLKKRYISKRISKPFIDEETGVLRPYKGVVSDVIFSRCEGCFLFHIEYDDDDDDEDMEHWELKKYLIE